MQNFIGINVYLQFKMEIRHTLDSTNNRFITLSKIVSRMKIRKNIRWGDIEVMTQK